MRQMDYLTQQSLLPPLEVQSFDAVSIHEGKEDCETNQYPSDWSDEVWFIAEMMLQVPFHSWIRHHPGHYNGVHNITIL